MAEPSARWEAVGIRYKRLPGLRRLLGLDDVREEQVLDRSVGERPRVTGLERAYFDDIVFRRVDDG